MGLFDKLKNKVQQVTAPPPPVHQHVHEEVEEVEPDTVADEPEAQFDVAGFDPDDEDSFFTAVLHMESEGQFGGTDESRAEIMQRYGIRDRSHWHTVKESVYALLIRKYGTMEEVGQREMNWRMGQMQNHMQQQVAKQAAGGGFEPVEGVSLEAWAAINASIVSGANPDDLLKGAGIDRARWERVSAEWNARMARDTTFAIAQIYGNAFQAASKGKFGDYAREAAAARAANRELAMEPPMSLEQFWEIMYEQSYAAQLGKDPVEALRSCGLTVVDWTDLGTYMGYFFHRTGVRNHAEYEVIHKRVEAKMAAKYPNVKPDVDITF
ncbi:MAG TPA: hypothetical protein VFQ53_15095 [Kofleriaceae bacterium]|nr:hypothetical protein [Kofleriaceae bacterium]